MQAVYIVYPTAMPTVFSWSRVLLRLIMTWDLGIEDEMIILSSAMLVEVKTLYRSSRPNPHQSLSPLMYLWMNVVDWIVRSRDSTIIMVG